MEDINKILELFDSREKWNAYIELSYLRSALVNELISRLKSQLCSIAEDRLMDSGWGFNFYDNGQISIYLKRNSSMRIMIETSSWGNEWYRRGASIYVNPSMVDCNTVFDAINANKHLLPMADYVDNKENSLWHLFVKQIPARIWGVENNVTSFDECLFGAKDNAQDLARNIWNDVFQPFAKKEIANLMLNMIKE